MSRELLKGLGSVVANGSSVIKKDDYLLFTGNVWPSADTAYIAIQSASNTFEYDITYESDAGNYFYIGFERYTANYTAGSNNSCVYQVSTNNSAHSKRRVRGVINLNETIADGLTTQYVRLRILNTWTGSSASSATAKIYNISLREITSNDNLINVKKNGILNTNTVWEGLNTASFNKLNVVESNTFYEY